MTDYTKYLTGQVTLGKMNRREFMGRAAAFGITLAAAGTLFDTAAKAQEPKRGGNLKLGLEGAAATDSICDSSVLMVCRTLSPPLEGKGGRKSGVLTPLVPRQLAHRVTSAVR